MRPAPACQQALKEATDRWPKRDRASDGICGDPRHASRTSDHNPNRDGWCRAFDLDHDPANGCDAHNLVRGLALRRDPRVKYIISESHIWNPIRGSAAAFAAARRNGATLRQAVRSSVPGWTRYYGSNPHDKHAHVSIYDSAILDRSPWWGVPSQKETGMFRKQGMTIKLVDDGEGMYVMGADGGMFTYGTAVFHGSAGGQKLNAPMIDFDVVGKRGYVMLAADYGLFRFSDPKKTDAVLPDYVKRGWRPKVSDWNRERVPGF